MRFFTVLGLALILTHEAIGEDENGIYIVKGAGSTSCERYVSDVRSNEQMFLLGYSWIQGYLTAYNNFVFSGRDVTAGVDSRTLRDWLDAHCKNHPDDDLAGAANALVNALLERES